MQPQDPPSPDIPPLDTALPVLRASLARGRYVEVLEVAEAYLAEHRGHRDLLYISAVAQRMLHRIPEALGTLATLQTFHPRYSRLFQERGHCHVMARDAAQACRAADVHLDQVSLSPRCCSWRRMNSRVLSMPRICST